MGDECSRTRLTATQQIAKGIHNTQARQIHRCQGERDVCRTHHRHKGTRHSYIRSDALGTWQTPDYNSCHLTAHSRHRCQTTGIMLQYPTGSFLWLIHVFVVDQSKEAHACYSQFLHVGNTSQRCFEFKLFVFLTSFSFLCTQSTFLLRVETESFR